MNAHINNDPLSIIYNERLWRISKVSPMYNFQYSQLKLKQYALKIRQAIVSSVSENTTQKYTVQIDKLPHLKFSERDSNGLMITVSSNIQNNKTKFLYSAILLSWGLSININEAIHLPFMLERGEQKFGTTVKNTLKTLFDCNIKQYCFTQSQLLHFVFHFIECDTSRSCDKIIFIYKTYQVNFKDQITLSFDIGDLRIIWNGVKDEVSRESEQVTLAYQILQNQLYHAFQLDIQEFDMCGVILPKAEIKRDGVLRMKTPEIINAVFTLLNEITDVIRPDFSN